MRFYIAAPIFNPHQLSVVEGIKLALEESEHDLFSPYHNSRDIWKGRAPKDCLPEERQKVLDDNINYLEWCDVLLAWVGGNEGGFTDPGVIWEMGFAHALKKTGDGGWPYTLAFINDDDERRGMNLMLAGTVDWVTVGYDQLVRALRMLKTGSGLAGMNRQFDPATVLKHEEERIG